jgi:hypothetical protein
VKLEGRFPNVAIDPTQPPGVTFRVTDRNGPVYTVTIPGGLWQLVPPAGTRWEFSDEGGEPAGFKLKLQARDVDLSAADLSGVNVEIAIPEPGGFSVTTAQRNRPCKNNGRTLVCR